MKQLFGRIFRHSIRRIKQLLPFVVAIVFFLYMNKDSFLHMRSNRLPVEKALMVRKGNISLLNATGGVDHAENVSITTKRTYTHVRLPSAVDTCQKNAELVKQACKDIMGNSSGAFTLTVRRSKDGSISYCPIYKVGTTFWRRVFMVHLDKKYSHLYNPYQIPFDKEYPSVKVKYATSNSLTGFKYMFTRDPYNRLFSFYVDKMVAPNPYFWKSVGTNIIKLTRPTAKRPVHCGHDVTFSEFIKFVIQTLKTRSNIDPHWIEMERNCRPCQVQYDYIGKMENFKDDLIPIIDKLGLSKMSLFLHENGSYVSNDDAIKDTLQQPFSFRTKYRICVSFKEAVQRAWYKLQIRGLVGSDEVPEHLLDERRTKMADLVTFAMHSGVNSKYEDRKAYKNKVYKDFWHTVPLSDLEKLRQLYKTDFILFDYDDRPSVIFERQEV
ncbi:hypothetical protein ACF0H5_016356 [Mactra antiquata]